MKKYEYKVHRIPFDVSVPGEMNVLGQSGWQVVDIERFRHFSDLLLMREIEKGDLGNVKHNHSISDRCYITCPLRGTEREIVR